MSLRSHLGSLLLLLSTTCLAFGAPATPSTSAPSQPAAGSTASATSSAAYDGYLRTNRYFQTMQNKAVEIETALRKLQDQSVAEAHGDNAKQQTTFLKKLIELYPGSTFDGAMGTVPIQKNFIAHFNKSLKVYSIKELGKINLEYLVAEGRIHLSDSVNSATILVDQIDPTRSTFINVTIPAIKEEAEKILSDPGRKRIAVDTVESAILNDAYQLLSMTNKVRMDIYGAYVISTSSWQNETLRTAASGYRDRHPEDYQGGVPSTTRKNKPAAATTQKTDPRLYYWFNKVVLFSATAVGVILAIIAGIFLLKSLSIYKSKNMEQRLFNSLSPMVTKSLKKFGTALWGKNLPWSKNYYIYRRKFRWILCDGKEDKINKIFKAHTKVEVLLRRTYFKIKITRLNKSRASIALLCKGLSEWELKEKLEEIKNHVMNPDNNGSMAARPEPEDGLAATENASIISTVAPEQKKPSEKRVVTNAHVASKPGLAVIQPEATDGKERMEEEDRYKSLSPMVTRSLKKLGTSLWGRNFPLSRNYYLYQRHNRWLLCDGREEKNSETFKARTRVDVCLRSTYFKIKITRLNKVSVAISLRCKDLSEWELLQGLEKIRNDIVNPNSGGSRDKDEPPKTKVITVPAAPAAPEPVFVAMQPEPEEGLAATECSPAEEAVAPERNNPREKTEVMTALSAPVVPEPVFVAVQPEFDKAPSAPERPSIAETEAPERKRPPKKSKFFGAARRVPGVGYRQRSGPSKG